MEKKILLNSRQRTETQNSQHWRNGFPDRFYCCTDSPTNVTICAMWKIMESHLLKKWPFLKHILKCNICIRQWIITSFRSKSERFPSVEKLQKLFVPEHVVRWAYCFAECKQCISEVVGTFTGWRGTTLSPNYAKTLDWTKVTFTLSSYWWYQR